MDLDFPVKFKLRVSITRLLSNALGVEVGGFGGEDILKRQTREKKRKDTGAKARNSNKQGSGRLGWNRVNWVCSLSTEGVSNKQRPKWQFKRDPVTFAKEKERRTK